MFRELSILLHKSRRRILSTLSEMFREGYTADDVQSVLQAAKAKRLKGSQIRAAQAELKEMKARLKGRDVVDKVARILSEEYGHSRSATESICLDAQGNPVPWYTYPAIECLRGWDFSEKDVFEYGSGYSTLFWSRIARRIISVEHDSAWHGRMAPMIPGNVEYLLFPEEHEYVRSIQKTQQRFDVIIIDGVHREECVSPALERLKDDGLIILDNSDWHPGIASLLRAADLIEVDMQGFGPINKYTWTTSFFFRRRTSLRPARARQPLHGPGSLPQLTGVSMDLRVEKPGLNGLDDKLAKHLDFRGGFFVEAGANDGFNQSNTFYLENSLGWNGILIEAIPDLANLCRKNRARSIVSHCALVADQEATPSVTVHYANLMSAVDGSLGDKKRTEQHIRKGLEVQNLPGSYTVEVPARTLSSVLDNLAPDRPIDFFSLDVEGYELEVLKGLDLGRHAPRFILVETSSLGDVSALLGENYDMVEQMSVHDYLFRHRSLGSKALPPSTK